MIQLICMKERGIIGVVIFIVIGVIAALGVSAGVIYYTQTKATQQSYQTKTELLQEQSQQPILTPSSRPTSEPKVTTNNTPTSIPYSPVSPEDNSRESTSLLTSWVIVFTHRGTPLPNEVVNFICNTIRPNVLSWINRELTKYQITKPFDSITCFSDQILLSEKQLLGGEQITGEAITFANPINTNETIRFLENKTPSFIKEKYITVFHYLVPTELQFTNYQYSPKYDFEFITNLNLPDGKMVFVPPLTDIDIYSQELVHEFMHKMGATDKYFIGFQQACLINPETGQQYSGYDIMCHRVSIPPYEGFATPKFSELIISEATAQEIKRQKIKEEYLDTSSITVISPNGGEIWKSGETHRIKWGSKGVSSIRIYIYNSKATGSGSTINITPNNQPTTSSAVGYYDWTILPINQLPGGVEGNNYKIIIDDADYSGENRDESDSLFNIIR